tara:strand:+ start:362 stop:2434 length:2073 start_codon:yes stop_codon:yes gene_type:complete
MTQISDLKYENIMLFMLVACWYFFNTIFIYVYKYTFDIVQDTISITSIQIFIGYLGYLFVEPYQTKNYDYRLTSILFWFGNVFTNLSYSNLNIIEAIVIKSSEPLFSQIMMMKYDFHKNYISVSMLVNICALFYFSSSRFWFISGLIANAFLQYRNILNKNIMYSETSPVVFLLTSFHKMIGIQLFSQVCFGKTFIEKPYICDISCGMKMFASIFVGINFILYQLFSIKVLEYVDPITHSFLNSGKRIFALFSIFVFQNQKIVHEQKIAVLQSTISIISLVSLNNNYKKTSLLLSTTGIMLSVIIMNSISSINNIKSEVHVNIKLPLLPPGLSLTDAEKMGATNNLGNLVWMEGALNLLDPNMNIIQKTSGSSSAVLFHADANIYSPLNISHYYCNDNCIESRLKLFQQYSKLIYIGSGIQMSINKNTDKPIQLRESNIKMLKYASTISKYIYVRGDTTANAIKYSSISNVVATGCPSLLLNTDSSLGYKLQAQLQPILHTAEDSTDNEYLEKTLKIGLAIHTPLHETAASMMLTILNLNKNTRVFMSGIADFWQHKSWKKQAHLKNITYDDVSSQFKYYYNNTLWREELSKLDIFISGRIHQGMMAIAAGIPAIIIPNDMRILELCKIMKIPYVEQISPKENLKSLLTKVSFNAQEFDKNRQYIVKLYKKSFDYFKLPMNPKVLSIIQP